MVINLKELTEIYEQMRDTFAQEAGFVPNDGCDAMVRLYALSAQVQSLLAQADWVLDQSFPQTAQGEYLDYHAQTRGITRAAATKASGVLRFSASGAVAADCVIEAGTVAMTVDGTAFETTERVTIEAGESSVTANARAVEAGAKGNAAAGQIRFLSALPAGVTGCTNPNAFTGGSDAESDEGLRERIMESYKRLPNGANAAFYEREAMSFEAVAAAKAVGRARGIGTVNVYVATHGGTPSSALLDEIAEALERKREIAVDIEVLAPTATTINVTAELSVGDGYDFAAVREEAERALGAYFTGERLGEDVLCAKLGALLYGVEGVTNCHLLAPTQDTACDATHLPTLGTVTLTEIGADDT